MRIKDKINTMYENCLYRNKCGYGYNPIICDGISFDPFLLNKNKDKIIKIERKVTQLSVFKDNPIYKEEIGDSAEKLTLMKKALEMIDKLDISDSNIEKRYQTVEAINNILMFFGIQLRFNKNKDKLVSVFKNDILIAKVKVRKDEESYSITFKAAGDKYKIKYHHSGFDNGDLSLIIQKTNGDKITIYSTKQNSSVTLTSRNDEKNTQTTNYLIVQNKGRYLYIRNDLYDLDTNTILANSELEVIKNEEIDKSESININESEERTPSNSKDLLYGKNALYSKGWAPVKMNDPGSKKKVYDEIISHQETKKTIIIVLDKLDSVMPGIRDYLLNKHKVLRDTLFKDVPVSSMIDDLMPTSSDLIYDENFNNDHSPKRK